MELCWNWGNTDRSGMEKYHVSLPWSAEPSSNIHCGKWERGRKTYLKTRWSPCWDLAALKRKNMKHFLNVTSEASEIMSRSLQIVQLWSQSLGQQRSQRFLSSMLKMRWRMVFWGTEEQRSFSAFTFFW